VLGEQALIRGSLEQSDKDGDVVCTKLRATRDTEEDLQGPLKYDRAGIGDILNKGKHQNEGYEKKIGG